jgi:hypothetical protein
MLLSSLPQGATKQHEDAKKLLKAFDLVGATLNDNANKLARKAEATGAAKEFFFHNGKVKISEEVFLHILDYLPKPTVVHKASMVCKPWLSATKNPWLWSKLDKHAGLLANMNMPTFLTVLARPQFSRLKTLVLPCKAQFSKATPELLARRCPWLEELDVGWTGNTVARIADQQLVELPNYFPNLTKISFGMQKVRNMGVYSFVEKMADRLLVLCIKGLVLPIDGPTGYLRDCSLIQIARVCPNLEEFTYWLYVWHRHYFEAHDAFSETGVMALFRGCTRLKHLFLVDTQNVGLEAFELIANTSGSSLKYLCVEGVSSLFGSANADHVRSRLEEHIENVVIARTSKRFVDLHYS